MKSDLLPTEKVIKEGAANQQKGWETVGGRLYLTNQRLVFESHSFNSQTGITIIQLSRIGTIKKAWTKLLNIFPLLPNSILINIENQQFNFVIFSRSKWIAAINQAKDAIS